MSADLAARFVAADDAWDYELVRLFGKAASAARFEKRGRGSFEDTLGALWLARDKARMAWDSRS